jgi:hypothetical protein
MIGAEFEEAIQWAPANQAGQQRDEPDDPNDDPQRTANCPAESEVKHSQTKQYTYDAIPGSFICFHFKSPLVIESI